MMTAIRSNRLVGPISICLAAIMLVLMMPMSALPKAEANEQTRLLLLFPVLDRSGSAYEDVGERATDYLQMAISEVSELRVAEFSRNSPMVLRAVEEGRIRSIDLETEVASPITAIQLGYALDVDEVCIATVESVQTSEEPRRIEVLVNGQCYDVEANVDQETLQVVEDPTPATTFGVSGKSRVREGYDGAMAPLLREALKDAAQSAAQILAGKSAADVEEEEKKGTGEAWKWIAAAAIVAGLILATSDAGDDDEGGPAADATAPQPIRREIETSAIELFWAAPNTQLQLLGYDLQRSTDDGQTWNPVPNSQGNILADDTVFADPNVEPGVSYRYRIRAQYAAAGPSPWAEFISVQFPER